MTDSERAVMTPIVFFDLFDRPVRRTALRRLAYRKLLSETEIEVQLERLAQQRRIVQHRGFVQLADRAGLTENALLRDQLSDELWAEAKTLIGRLAVVPFVRLIAVINSLAFHNAHANSDIDLLIVTEPHWLAVARSHLLALLTLWGRRGTGGIKRGKLAPDVFLDAEHLALDSFHAGSGDRYIDYWGAWLAPVIDRAGTYQKLLAANAWIRTTFPGFRPHTVHLITSSPEREARRERWERWWQTRIGRRLANALERGQEQRLTAYQHRVGAAGLVTVSPWQLRFHVPDRRREYQDSFEARWTELTASR